MITKEHTPAMTTLANLSEMFLSDMALRQLSVRTQGLYRAWLRRWLAFLEGRQHSLRLQDLKLDDSKAYLAALLATERKWAKHPTIPAHEAHPGGGALSPFTIHQAARILRTFGNWLKANGYGNPLEGLKMPQTPKAMLEPLTPEEVTKLLDSINAEGDLGARAYALVMLILDTGLRASEVVELRLSRIDLQQRILKVTGKGSKDRIVPFGQQALRALTRYLTVFRPEPTPAAVDRCFLAVDGHPLSYNGLALIFKRLRSKSGIQRLRAHLLRHTFAVNYLMSGGDIRTLQLILGHESPEQTLGYLHLSQQHLLVQHHSFSPMDRLQHAGGQRRRFSRPRPGGY